MDSVTTERHARIIRSLAAAIVGAALLLTPLKVVSHGFLPADDALRHAAKAVAGKDWSEILVLRPGMTTDRHEGWHSLLTSVRQLTGWGVEGLVVFSVVLLSVLLLWAPIPWLSRPEMWPFAVVLISVVAPSFVGRLMLGRPYLLTMAVTVIICLLWPRLENRSFPWGASLCLAGLIAVSTWFHGVPHLWVVPLAAFLLTRKWRVAWRFGLILIAGALAGASLSGRPLTFLAEGLSVSRFALGGRPLPHMIVPEFQASSGEGLTVLTILFLLLWRCVRGEWNNRQIWTDPVFVLMGVGWALGFTVQRFWWDWGMVAALVWMAREFDAVAVKHLREGACERIVLASVAGILVFLAVSSDVGGRWTQSLTREYLSLENPRHRDWLPGPGGILYSDNSHEFYETFFRNPHGEWRYILGFEQALMPEEDLVTLRRIQWNFGAEPAFAPWVAKMREQDRLVLRRPVCPRIPELEWHRATTDTWVGRLPKRPSRLPGG